MENSTLLHKPAIDPSVLQRNGFKIHEVFGDNRRAIIQGRRDYYKIVLLKGDVTLSYNDTTLDIHDSFLYFANPHVPHSVVHHSMENYGYGCLFTEKFIAGRERTDLLQHSPLFQIGADPVIPLDREQAIFMTGIFEKMMAVNSSVYDYKYELLRSCIELILHEVRRIQPTSKKLENLNAATRITHMFLELLESQFPIESSAEPLKLRSALDFSRSLAVHVNYLNRSVKAVTGNPTTVIISERIVAEAKALLRYTDWSVGNIAYSLGFEYPTYFNNYFKRIAGGTPKSFRKNKD